MFTQEQKDFVFVMAPQLHKINDWLGAYMKEEIGAGPFVLPSYAGRVNYDENGRIIAAKFGFLLGGHGDPPQNFQYTAVVSQGYIQKSQKGVEWKAKDDKFNILDLNESVKFLVDCYNTCLDYMKQGIAY